MAFDVRTRRAHRVIYSLMDSKACRLNAAAVNLFLYIYIYSRSKVDIPSLVGRGWLSPAEYFLTHSFAHGYASDMESKFSQLVWFVNEEGKITCFVISLNGFEVSPSKHRGDFSLFASVLRSEEIEISVVDRRKMSYRCFSIRSMCMYAGRRGLTSIRIPRVSSWPGWIFDRWTVERVNRSRFVDVSPNGVFANGYVGMRVARIYVRDVVKETVRGLQTDVSFEFSNRWWWHIRCARGF